MVALVFTAVLYSAYKVSTLRTPGSDISLSWLFSATTPFFASLAIALAIIGFLFVISEFFVHFKSWQVRLIFVTIATGSAVLLTFQTAVAIYAVMVWLLIAGYISRINPILLIAVMAFVGILSEFTGSYFASILGGASAAGLYVPIWAFPVVFMALITLLPVPCLLKDIDPKSQVLAVFGAVFAAGVLIAFAGVIFSAGIYMQPDFLPQAPLSIATNTILGIVVAGIFYRYLSIKMNRKIEKDNGGIENP